MTTNDGGTAFPVLERGGNGLELTSLGLSVRDYFAAAAMQGMFSNPDYTGPINDITKLAYETADSMLETRK